MTWTNAVNAKAMGGNEIQIKSMISETIKKLVKIELRSSHAVDISFGAQTSLSTVNNDDTAHFSNGLLPSSSFGGSGILGSCEELMAQNPLCPGTAWRTSGPLSEDCRRVLLGMLCGLSGGVMGSLEILVVWKNASSSFGPVTSGFLEYSDATRDQKESRCVSYILQRRLWSMPLFPLGFCVRVNEEVPSRKFLVSFDSGVTDRIGGKTVGASFGRIGTCERD